MATAAEVMVQIGVDGVPTVLNALKQVDGAVAKVGKTTKSTGKEMADVGKSGGNALVEFGQKWQGAIGMITTATLPAMAVIKGVKAAIEFSQEGAEIDYTRQKFDRLALTIGTTGNALREDLIKASRGVKSEFELTSLASEMMSLKLAKNHNDLVRLGSVASALNMNMNQLTLALANKSTQRLDQLGLSVETVTTKIEELKKAGMSDDAAYFEAFVRAAEEVVKSQGHVADTTLGAWQKMKAAQADYFNGMKENMSEAMSWWPEFWGKAFEGLNEERRKKDLINDLLTHGLMPADMEQAWNEQQRVLSRTPYQASSLFYEQYKIELENIAERDKRLEASYAWRAQMQANNVNTTKLMAGDMTQQWADMNDGVREYVTNTNFASEAMTNFASSFESLVSLSNNFGSVVKLATQYDGILGEIGDASARIKELEPFKETGGYIDGVWMSASKVKKEIEGLEGVIADGQAAMKRMADQMTLDMLQATIAIGGVTQAEAEAYFDMAADMGLISRDAADAAIAAFQNAVETIGGMSIDPITGEIRGNADHFWTVFDQVRFAKIAEKVVDFVGNLKPLDKDFTYAEGKELTNKVMEIMADSGMAEEEINEVNAWRLMEKTGLVSLASDLAKSQFDDIESWSFNPKWIDVKYNDPGHKPNVPASVTVGINYGASGYTQGQRAIGGPVYPNKLYTWQEPGREGELLVTEKYGRVMSNHEVAMAIRDAIIGAKNETSGGGSQPIVNNYYTYNLTMPTSSNPADVKTAFELMEAWNK